MPHKMPTHDGYSFRWGWRALSVCQLISHLAKVLGIALSLVCGYIINRGLPGISLVGGTDSDDKIALRCKGKDDSKPCVHKALHVTEGFTGKSELVTGGWLRKEVPDPPELLLMPHGQLAVTLSRLHSPFHQQVSSWLCLL